MPTKPKYACLFPKCTSAYTRKNDRDRHLSSISADNYDENHPQESDLWRVVEDSKTSRKGACPNTGEQQAAKITKIDWQHLALEAIGLSQKLAHLAESKSARLAALQSQMSGDNFKSNVPCELWHSAMDLSEWLHLSSGINDGTFARFVTFFLPPKEWPNSRVMVAYDDDNPAPRVVECLPNVTICRTIQGVVRRNLGFKMENLVKRSWDMFWRPFVTHPRIQDACLWTAYHECEFASQSSLHDTLTQLHQTWQDTIEEAQKQLCPTNFSLSDLHQLLTAGNTVGDSAASGELDNEEEIWTEFEGLKVMVEKLNNGLSSQKEFKGLAQEEAGEGTKHAD